MMDEDGGSYGHSSCFFSSCLRDMRWKEYNNDTRSKEKHSYNSITRTCPLCAPVGGSQALLPLCLPPLSSLSCNLVPLLHLFLPSTLVSRILVVSLQAPERGSDPETDTNQYKPMMCDSLQVQQDSATKVLLHLWNICIFTIVSVTYSRLHFDLATPPQFGRELLSIHL